MPETKAKLYGACLRLVAGPPPSRLPVNRAHTFPRILRNSDFLKLVRFGLIHGMLVHMCNL